MPHQVLLTSDGVGIAIGNDEEIISHRGDGVIVVVGNDNAVVLGSFSNHCLHVFNVHRVNLCERFIQDVERSIAVQYQVEFGQAGFAAESS